LDCDVESSGRRTVSVTTTPARSPTPGRRSRAAARLNLAGFMTHLCVSSTARGAFELGYVPTVVAATTATRPLVVTGEVASAASVQVASLAALADPSRLWYPTVRRSRLNCRPAHRATVRP
jgi:hypothetical protein